jgi:hypothetical protein
MNDDLDPQISLSCHIPAVDGLRFNHLANPQTMQFALRLSTYAVRECLLPLASCNKDLAW